MIITGYIFIYTVCVVLVSSNDLSEDKFVEMVLKNISDLNNYILPTNNEKLTRLTNNKNIFDFGTFDFVIVGAGAAGSVLANRLSEMEHWKILLLEAGGYEDYFSDIPGMDSFLLYSDMNWGYLTTPQTTCCLGMNDNKCINPRGKVIGGSSTINAKQYVRGNKEDYNLWEKMGNTGWGYEHVLPYFKKSENNHITDTDCGYHGTCGLLDVDRTEPSLFTSIFLRANQELGLPYVDYNGKQQIGVAQSAVLLKDGFKSASAGRCFVDPVLNRTNLKVVPRAFVTKLLIDRKTKTATGVKFIYQGKLHIAKTSKEVLLSAGSINSAQVLMLSGVGPKAHLENLGIKCIQDLPVGQNLQDHPMFIGLLIKTNQTVFNKPVSSLLRDYLHKRRPYTLAYNADSVCFFNTKGIETGVPDIQLVLVTPPGGDTGKIYNLHDNQRQCFLHNSDAHSDITISVILLHEKSKGSVTLKSKNYNDFPNTNLNLFSDENNEDIDIMYKGILHALKLLETSAFKSINATLRNVVVGCEDHEILSKEYWYCAIRRLSTPMYHLVGTTRMGVDPINSVVTPQLKAHGIKKLRVIDAGIIPEITSGPTVAPTYMIAEKLADDIKLQYMQNNC